MTVTQGENDIAAAIKDLEKVVEQNPDNVIAHHQLGLVYRQAGRIEDAISELEKAIQLDDQSVESLINLGAIFYSQGDIDRALALNEKVLKIAPNMAEAHVNIGLIRQQQNRVVLERQLCQTDPQGFGSDFLVLPPVRNGHFVPLAWGK